MASFSLLVWLVFIKVLYHFLSPYLEMSKGLNLELLHEKNCGLSAFDVSAIK